MYVTCTIFIMVSILACYSSICTIGNHSHNITVESVWCFKQNDYITSFSAKKCLSVLNKYKRELFVIAYKICSIKDRELLFEFWIGRLIIVVAAPSTRPNKRFIPPLFYYRIYQKWRSGIPSEIWFGILLWITQILLCANHSWFSGPSEKCLQYIHNQIISP